jgi:hypothetical protein
MGSEEVVLGGLVRDDEVGPRKSCMDLQRGGERPLRQHGIEHEHVGKQVERARNCCRCVRRAGDELEPWVEPDGLAQALAPRIVRLSDEHSGRYPETPLWMTSVFTDHQMPRRVLSFGPFGWSGPDLRLGQAFTGAGWDARPRP